MAFFFTPPTVPQKVGREQHLDHRGPHTLWGRLNNAPWGKNVYITQDDEVRFHGTIDEHSAAKYLYFGGRTYEVSSEERDILVAAGLTVEED